MRYRSRSEIVCSILGSVGDGNTKTRIMHDSSLSYVQIMQYLSALERNNLVEQDDRVYKMTRKGRIILGLCMGSKPVPGLNRLVRNLY